MESSTPVKEMVFVACAAVGLSWNAPRDSKFSTEIGKKLFAYGEELFPTHEKASGFSSWARRSVSNMTINVAHLTEVASLAADALRNQVLGVSAMNPEVEKKLAEMQQALNQQLAFNADCQKAATEFQEVVEEFQVVNRERSNVCKTVSTELQALSSIPGFSLEVLSEFFADFKNLAEEQPMILKQFAELAIQLGEEKKWQEQAQKQIQQLEKELPKVMQQSITNKTELQERLQSLTPLIEKATPDRSSGTPSGMKTGITVGKAINRVLFIVDPT